MYLVSDSPFRFFAVAFIFALGSAVFPTYASAQAAPATPAPAASAAASSAPTAVPAPAATADPAITARAQEWLHRIQTANLDRSQLTPEADAAFTDSLIKQVAAQVGPLGDPVSFTFVNSKVVSPNTAYVYKVSFKDTAFYYIFALAASGKISGLRLVPAQ